MFQVLEHLDRLDELFAHLNVLASPHASLFIAVPNSGVIEFYQENGALLDMPPNHVGRWNKLGFKTIAERHGFQLVDHKVERARFPHMHYKYLKYCHLRASQKSGSFANRVESKPDGVVRNLLRVISLLRFCLSCAPAIYGLQKNMGSSQWVHLRRIPN